VKQINAYGLGISTTVIPYQFQDLVGTGITHLTVLAADPNKTSQVYGVGFSTDTTGHYELYIGTEKVNGWFFPTGGGQAQAQILYPFYLDNGVINSEVYLLKPDGSKIDGVAFIGKGT